MSGKETYFIDFNSIGCISLGLYPAHILKERTSITRPPYGKAQHLENQKAKSMVKNALLSDELRIAVESVAHTLLRTGVI
jgi:hypothetical protein